MLTCTWCDDGLGSGVCRSGGTCDAPFVDAVTSVTNCVIVSTTTPTATATTSDPLASATTGGARGSVDDNSEMDPALLWGLVGGGICLFLLLLILCIVLIARKRRNEQPAEATDLKDLPTDSGVSLYDEPLPDDEALSLGDTPTPSSRPNPGKDYGSVANLAEPGKPAIVYSALKETNASMAAEKKIDVNDSESL
jgi:hypothetical protein